MDPRDEKLPTANQFWYEQFAIEPIDFIRANRLDFLSGNVIKYVMRHRAKGGLADLQKAMVYLRWMMQDEEEK